MNLNNIYVFGTFDNIQEINQFLKNDCEIHSYCDFDENCFADSFDLKPLLPISKLCPDKNDVVIISYDDKNKVHIIEQKLIEIGFSQNRIISFSEYFYTNYANPLARLPSQINKGIDTLLFGMSHSQNGLFFSKFSEKVFPFVGPSLDLFLYKKFLEAFIGIYNETATIKDIVIEMPYYFFNYDLSLQKEFVKTKMNYFSSVNDYHHINLLTIKRFEIFKEIFCLESLINKNAIEKNRSYIISKKRFQLLRRIKKHYLEIKKVDKVWKNEYPQTIAENKKLLSEFFELVASNFPNASVTVLVLPLSPAFRKKNRKIILQAKNNFYSNLSCFNDIKIDDHFNDKIKDKYFLDYCHLYFDGKTKLNIYKK